MITDRRPQPIAKWLDPQSLPCFRSPHSKLATLNPMPRPIARDHSTLLPIATKFGCLLLTLLVCIGCGGSSAKQKETSLAKQTPEAQFEWGMERLDRALRMSKPSSADGLYTERKLSHELIPPNGENQQYTATVTITTEAEFIHGRRKTEKKDKEEKEVEQNTEYKDPREQSAEVEKLIDFPGAGPKAPTAPAPIIESRSLDNETVFNLAYVDQQWKLTNEPEHKYEKLWFEYAFPAQ